MARTIEIGDTSNDLGARVVASESDLNLVFLLNGATTTAVLIDSDTLGEHTILYTVTSPTSGLTGSIMRTVVVSPAEELPAPVEENGPLNSPEPKNDNASSTPLASGM